MTTHYNTIISAMTGSVSTPSFIFGQDTDTGLYASNSNEISFTIGGTNTTIYNNLETRSSVNTLITSANPTGALYVKGEIASDLGFTTSGNIVITNTTEATSNTSGGTITTAGGLATAKRAYIGGPAVVNTSNLYALTTGLTVQVEGNQQQVAFFNRDGSANNTYIGIGNLNFEQVRYGVQTQSGGRPILRLWVYDSTLLTTYTRFAISETGAGISIPGANMPDPGITWQLNDAGLGFQRESTSSFSCRTTNTARLTISNTDITTSSVNNVTMQFSAVNRVRHASTGHYFASPATDFASNDVRMVFSGTERVHHSSTGHYFASPVTNLASNDVRMVFSGTERVHHSSTGHYFASPATDLASNDVRMVFSGTERVHHSSTGHYFNGAIDTIGNMSINSGLVKITNTTDSTSSSTGALTVTGGVGIGGSLNITGGVSYAVRALSSTSNINDSDYVILATNTITLSLPSISTSRAGKTFFIVNEGSGTITIDTQDSATFNDASTASITLTTQYEHVTLINNGTVNGIWYIS